MAAATLVPETQVEKTLSPASATEKGSSEWEKKVRHAASTEQFAGRGEGTQTSQSVAPGLGQGPEARERQTGEWN
jgi:hypothetical protein